MSLGSIKIVERDLKHKDDDLAYARFRFPDHPEMNFERLLPFETRGGKDEHGKFVRIGDSREIVDCMAPTYGYRPQRLRQWRGRDSGHSPLFGEPCEVSERYRKCYAVIALFLDN